MSSCSIVDRPAFIRIELFCESRRDFELGFSGALFSTILRNFSRKISFRNELCVETSDYVKLCNEFAESTRDECIEAA